jgi:putative ABC transport system permease protein
VAQAQAELETIAQRLAADYPDTNEGFTVRLVPLMTALVGGTRTAVLALGGAVVLVLLMSCAIVANLLLARGLERDRELSVRAALGARGWQLARGLLAESTLLALAGGGLGILLATAGVALFRSAVPLGFPRGHQIAVDGRLLLCALGLALLSTVLVSLIPTLRALRPELAGALRASATGSGTGRTAHRVQGGLVLVQVALALLLIVGAGLLLQSFRTLSAVDPGFSSDPDTIVAQLLLTAARYPDAERRRSFVRNLQERLGATPGVTSVGLTSHLPLGGTPQFLFEIVGRPSTSATERPVAYAIAATPGYLETMGIPLQRGRIFGPQDDERGPPVVIIDEALAATWFPD